jgi:hypothetical protein
MFARPIPTGEERVLRQARLNADPSESGPTENDSTEAGLQRQALPRLCNRWTW